MGGGHSVFVIDLAIGSLRVVIGRAVPAGNSNFRMQDGTGGFRSGLGGECRGRSLRRGRRRGRGGLNGMMTAAGDGEAQDQQSGQSSAKGEQGIPELHNLLMLPCCDGSEERFGCERGLIFEMRGANARVGGLPRQLFPG